MKKRPLSVLSVILQITSLICSLLLCLGNIKEVSETSSSEYKELPVIMYHALTEDPEYMNRYFIAPSCFEEDLRFIKENGYDTVTVSDLIKYTEAKGDLPQKPVMLIFDDGYYNNLKYALPLLRKYGSKAVIAPVGKTSDEYSINRDRNEHYAYLSWDDLRAMQITGNFEIQNHSYDLHNIKDGIQGVLKYPWEDDKDYHVRLTEDLKRFQDRAASMLLTVPQAFVYPYGAYDKKSEDIIKAFGFKATFTCTEGINVITRDKDSLFLLKRFLRSGERSLSDILETR